MKQKDANNEVTYDVPNYVNAFNIFERRRKLLDRLDVSYERACMATPKEEYFTDILDSLIKHNICHGMPFSNKNLQEAVCRVTEEEEKDVELFHGRG